MARLWIIGNSGAARECYWIFRDMLKHDPQLESQLEFGGFLSWRGHPPNLRNMAGFLKGEALEMPLAGDDVFAIGIGEPRIRADVFAVMQGRGASFCTLRHPLADISPDAICGEANIFQRACSLFSEAAIGNANYLNGAVNISHDAIIGDANFLGPFSLILGNCRVGCRNLLATHATLLPNCRIGDDNIITPGSIVYKGCGSNRRMSGNPALPTGKA